MRATRKSNLETHDNQILNSEKQQYGQTVKTMERATMKRNAYFPRAGCPN